MIRHCSLHFKWYLIIKLIFEYKHLCALHCVWYKLWKCRYDFQLMASTKLSKHPFTNCCTRVFPFTKEFVLLVDIKDNLKLIKFLVVFYRYKARIYFKVASTPPHPLTLTTYPTPGVRWYPNFFMKMTAKDVKEITLIPLVTFFSVLEWPGKNRKGGCNNPPG